jgi:flagellar basal body P-ring formation protein FlgA
MTRITIGLVSAICASVAMSYAALADSNPRLRSNITVEAQYVTLGDIFDNAGDLGDRPVFQAPEPGQSGTVRADRIEEAARDNGLIWRDTGQVGSIQVSRASTILATEEITRVVEVSLRERLNLSPSALLDVSLRGNIQQIHLPINFAGEIVVTRLDYAGSTGQFRAEIAARDDSSTRPLLIVSGKATETARVPVLSRDIQRGETITVADIEMIEIPRQRLTNDILRNPGRINGMAARRALSQGRPLSESDIEPPKLVLRNTLVTLIYSAPGMVMTARGRSLDDGALGDTVKVMNVRSNRMIEGVVRSNGDVAVTPNNSTRILAAGSQGPTQIATATR